ncbi:hypothetical protein WBJ53_09085 [Spirosoma sp. SC4-14]|uniref:hypothetical protein n=1 Tax=Spirosoma sp. SC4-14 TaxID=3128900 RepID=UPI0030D04436
MKSTAVLLLAVSWLASCNNSQTQKNEKATADSASAQPTSTVVGNDKDEHGCIGSAGYIWSPVRNDCIRVFEQIKLQSIAENSADSAAAFLLFSTDRKQAELFLPGRPEGLVLTETGEKGNQHWTKDSLEIILWKGYVVRMNDKPIYHGDDK